MAEAPIVADTVAIRAAFDIARSRGFVRNIDPQGHDLSNIDRRAGRVSMAYKNQDGFDALLRVFAADSSPEAVGAINQGIFDGGSNARGVNPRVNPYNGRPLTSSEGAYDRSGIIRTHGIGTNLLLNEEFGSFVLTSITSLLKGHFTNLVDADGSYLDLLHIDFYADTREISQDLRIATGGEGPFKLIAGLYYFQDRVTVDTTYHLFDEATVLRQEYTQRRRSYAGYVDGTYDFFPALTAYAGIRHTDDEGDIHDFRVMPTIPGPLSARYHDTAPTGRAGIRWKVGSDSMAYAQYARGYRSSAINGGALTAAADFNVAKPEKIDTYEVGSKSQWFERRLTTNASAFRYDFSNQQFVNVAGIDNQQLVNAGRSRITGVELESAGKITDALELSVGVGLLHSVYKTLTLGGTNLAGNELIEAPHHTVSLGLDYTVNLAGGGALVLHGDGVNVGAQFYSAYNNIPPYNLLKTASFWDANTRVSWHDVSGRYEIALWGKNVFGNQVATGMQIDPTTGTLFTTAPYRARYGAEVGIRF
jgi:iron complex outermembrane receptor protein